MTSTTSAKQISLGQWLKARARQAWQRFTQPPGPEDMFEETYDFSNVDPDVVSEVLNVFMKAVVTGIVSAAAIQVAYAIYAVGGLVNMLAVVMASICQSGGSCSVPTLLTTITLSVLLLLSIVLMLVSPIRLMFGPSQWYILHDHLATVEEKLAELHQHLGLPHLLPDPVAMKKERLKEDRRKLIYLAVCAALAVFMLSIIFIH
jgi:hypothetical protein